MASGLNLVRDALLAADGRLAMLRAVAALGLPDCWIAAGVVRNAVWDALHGYVRSTPLADVDVIWFDSTQTGPDLDRALEDRLAAMVPGVVWSVKNQARMHARNGHAPYADCREAMRFWPETATGVAARMTDTGSIEVQSAYGLHDLLGLLLRPAGNEALFRDRVAAKRWLEIWPKLLVVAAAL